ncbi:hypothetical protein Zmor_018361 [Zophobas morio]|uniref:Ketosynthase family 3 (KS3) domain-containing protein n=1 Tax=Zophobas morio TaxID=2755281 RepID=A0AA38IDR0_9CUCU|nr:hypothetical protein Zmor_018361 [Zophobas morio]
MVMTRSQTFDAPHMAGAEGDDNAETFSDSNPTPEDAGNLQILFLKRNRIHDEISRFKLWFETNNLSTSASRLRVRLRDFVRIKAQFDKIHSQIEALDDTTSDLEQATTRLYFENAYYDLCADVEDAIEQKRVNTSSPAPQEIYRESNITFSNVSYFEAHGTGTKAGDPEEVKAVDRALANKCERQLLVGSLNSNMGHAEAASGICSIIKIGLRQRSNYNEAVLKMLNDVSTKSLDEEYISLLHQLYKVNFPNHSYRGYAIVSKGGVVSMSSKLLPTQRPGFHVLFGRFVNTFRTIAYHLMNFSIFKYVQARINEILIFNNVKSFQEILKCTTEPVEDVLGSICLQLIVVDIFKILQLSHIVLFGDSFGKIVVAYYFNVIKLEDAVSAAIKFSKKNITNIVDSKLKELMGDGYENIINQSKPTLTLNITDLHHNGENNLVGENGDINFLDEIYRELCLRGYSYSGLFKAIKRCNIKASMGVIGWKDNWCTFMDNMLQMKILGIDTRLLYVPDGEERLLPVYVNEDCNIITSGLIQIHGLQVKSVFNKKLWIEPVLGKHVFVPNHLSLDLDEVLRINTQIILESTFKAVEIINKFTDKNAECILGFVNKALVDLPLVNPDLTISSKTTVDESLGIQFESVTLTSESNILLYIGSKVLQKSDNLQQFLTTLSKNGFVLTREDINFKVEKHINKFEILTDYVTPNERIILFRKKMKIEKSKFIEISSYNFDWLPELQNVLNLGINIIVYATNQVPEGILGLIKCIRREASKNFIQCFFMVDDAPEFDPEHSFYSKQISKNLAINVYKNKSWGTYRHLRLEESPKIVCDDTYAYFKTRGDISSFEWSEGPLTKQLRLKKSNSRFRYTYYSSINFKNIMASTGRITPEIELAKNV